jgi:streptogramin lyase
MSFFPPFRLHELRAPGTALILATGILALACTGCGTSTYSAPITAPPSTGSYTGVNFSGKAFAGTQPLIGASVQLYAAGATGDGSSASALLPAALITGANGAFTVAGYNCPASSSLIYLVATGGKPGASSTSANPAITLLTALGPCNQIVVSSEFILNEVTTAASAYALSQFLSNGANLGATSTNTIGLGNAVATAQALADITAGTSPGPAFASNGSSPATKINSLANLLNTCTAAIGNACGSLFAATTPTGGPAPANTLDAALELVRNPAANVGTLFTLASGSTAFVPALSSSPTDWTLFINYTGGGMNGPSGLGVDSGGDIWVASYFNAASVFSPLGKPLLPQGITGFGLSASYGLAVDQNNHAWIPNAPNYTTAYGYVSGNSVDVFDSAGNSYAGSGGYTGAGLDYPIAVAIDTDGSAWIVNNGDSSLTHLSSSGQALSGASGYSSSQLAYPVDVAIDASHNVWISDQNGNDVVKVSPDGTQFTSFACCNSPAGLAFDQHGNLWIANYYGDSISEISSAGIILSSGISSRGGIHRPQGVAIDGAGNVWIANYLSPNISELAGVSNAGVAAGTALSPANGLGSDASLNEAYAIAGDASGNLWITNFGNNMLTEFVGLAAPVRTPQIGPPSAP